MLQKILKLPDVESTTVLKRSSIYSYIKEKRFPKPIPLGSRAVGWLENEITDWIKQRAGMRGEK